MGREGKKGWGEQRAFALLPGMKKESGEFSSLVREVKPPLFGPPRKGPTPPPVFALFPRKSFMGKFRSFMPRCLHPVSGWNSLGLLAFLGLTAFAVGLFLVILLALYG